MTDRFVSRSLAASMLSRRKLLALAGGTAAAGLVATPGWANSGAWQRLDEALAVVGDATPVEGGLALELPLVSENGAAVPLTLTVDAPTDGADAIESVHIFAPRNPYPEIAVFHFGPQAGRAEVATRVRLNESQTMIAIARLASGEVRVAEREVRVTVTGCLVAADTYESSNIMQTRVRTPERFTPGTPGEVLTMINHPMETGLHENLQGELLPKRIIEKLEAEIDGEPVFVADLRRSVSANPYLRFHIAPARSGTLTLRWTEDTGEVVEEVAPIEVG